MENVFKYVWILFILATIFNVYFFKNKIKKYIVEKPERETGYNTILKNYTIFGLIPWLIIGIGNITGQTNSFFDYFQPAKLNPFVLLFHFSIIVIWALLIRFIYFKDGARFLVDHPGIIQFTGPGLKNQNLSENSIKIFIALLLLGGIAAMTIMWTIDFPMP